MGKMFIKWDIAERKQVELECETILHTAMDSFLIIDSETCILDVNDSYCHLIGYSRDELLNMTIKDIEAVETPKIIGQRVQRIKEVGWDRFETRHMCKDGRIVEIEASINYMEIEGGKFYVFMRDITSGKQTEKMLKESEEKYRLLIENIQDGVFVIQDSKIQFCNEAFARIGGYTVDEVIGRDFKEFVAPEDLEMVVSNYYRRQSGEDIPKEYEFRILRKDGERAIVNINVGVFTYRGRVASIGTLKDITEQKRAEKALRESENKYRTLIQNIPEKVFLKDRKSVYISCNSHYAEELGIEPDEIAGKTDFDFYTKDLAEKYRNNDAWVMEFGKTKEVDEEYILKDKRLFIHLIKTPVTDKEGNIIGVLGIFHDITERKKAFDQIKASLQEKEVLLREIHHRVKNNMQIIASLLRLQSSHLKEKKYSEMLKESYNRIMSMSLMHEKLYRSKNLAKIDIKNYIRDLTKGLIQSYCVNNYNSALNFNVENISLEIDSAIPCGLIITELVSNSLKYAFPDGRDGKIEISFCAADENWIELTVRDNGVGIPENVDFRNTKSLGLQLVAMLVDQIDGEINLNRGNGTEFKIKFKESEYGRTTDIDC